MRIGLAAAAILSLLTAFPAQGEPPTRTALAGGETGQMLFWSHSSTGPREFIFKTINIDKQKSKAWGDLWLPKDGTAPYPAMIISHGSSGLAKFAEHYYAWARHFTSMGVAVFVLDHFTPRGIKEVASDQLSFNEWTVATDVIYALRLLATHPKIDKTKIGVVGFSKGGNASLFSAFEVLQETIAGPELRLALHMPFYPSCNSFYLNMKPTKAPIIFFLGEKDENTPASECVKYSAYLKELGARVETVVYPGAYHGFDFKGSRTSWVAGSQNWGKCFKAYDPITRTMTRRDTGQKLDLEKKEDIAYSATCVSHGYTAGGDDRAREAALKRTQEAVKAAFFSAN